MSDLDCDCDFGDCDCDCDCCCCCCCCDDCDCDCDKSCSWDKICCIICINVDNDNGRRHNPHDDTCYHLCCCCCCDDNYQRRRVPTQSKQEEFNPKNQEEKRRKESDFEHAPNCPCRGSPIPKNRCPYKCWLASPSLDLDPPMIQRFQALDREKYVRGYESSGKRRHYW
ncbi:hypothetical protein P3X46_024563 [Hevea brasiliensis]|uniref:Uncharacterized protein n=1 Tax=Hevea brasiliensis TaxID=3981 RepID=A0ABQ9L6G0_HEVBR|nr:uncharacterized protein LOC110669018 isoform X1 [Hevea brasiliensis]XP_021686164.2 uncharacterized protein LOC110669018 isoform X1 [Hevea brasiliensis]KAJ9159031.1 hypothetical protein P3X46_024563 [Hevea brasiliensis]